MSFFIKTQNFIDKYVFSIPCLIFRASEKEIPQIKKILIVKLWALGDSITLLPTIDALRKKYPKAEIDILANKRNKIVFEGQKFINKIIDFNLFNVLKSTGKYNICIDAEPFLNVSAVIAFLSSKYTLGFSHGARSNLYNSKVLFNKKQHMVQNYLDFARKLGINYNTDKLVPLSTDRKDREAVHRYLEEHNVTKKDFVVGIAPGVAESVKYRMWPIEKVALLGDELIKKYDAKIIFIDSKGNIPLINKIQKHMNGHSLNAALYFGNMKQVKQSAELMKNCKIIISNDSGPMHIAAAEGVKTIGLFGPNTPVLWGPYGKGNISIFKPKKGCPYLDNTKRELVPKHLTKEQLTCMDAISVDDVMKAVEKIL